MAGNLVKWWKHKILGGYKQFSVQECTTDSEELMYHQVRASSSCSAPPDLLLVSDRENNIPLRSPVVNIIAATAASATAPTTTTTSPSSGINACHLTSATNNNQHRHNQQKLQYHHQQQQQQQQQHHQVTTQQLSLAYNNSTKDIISSGGVAAGKHQKQSGGINNGSGSSSGNKQHGGSHQQDMQQPLTISHDIVDGQIETQQQINNHSSIKQQQQHAHHNQQTQQQQSQQQQHQQPHHNHHQQRPEEHIRLEEFTCDVSVEGGKSSQPLQFSFTFYDLDGHHGKITKDDIVGIVYTIYESIGKSVVVPHSGSKTINVRLTVSPEGKTKSTKNKKALDHNLHPTLLNNSSSHQKASALASNSQAATRRLHRYRPRKLIKSDEEDDDSNSDKERMALKANTKAQKLNNKLKAEQSCCTQQQQQQLPSTIMSQQTAVATDLPNSPLDTIYANLNASSPPETCRECLAAADEARNTSISPLVSAATTTTNPLQFPIASKTSTTTNEAYMKHVASTRIKMLRKSRKQKHQDCLDTRQRSLSVGNETCWKNRHLQPKHHNQQQLLLQAEQQLNHSVGVGGGGSDIVVDGVQLRNPLKNGKSMMTAATTEAQKRNSAECWKTALNRNDLISIIRESMEKNRLCFQLNGKPQANVSPIRQSPSTTTNNNNNNSSSSHQQQLKSVTKHSQANAQRQRSNTVSKIPTLIANHNNAAHHLVSPQHHQRSSSCANTISSYNNNNNNSSQQQQHDLVGLHEPHNIINSSSNSNNIYHQHLQPHIPIYHQQMAINPAVIAAQNALLTATAPTSGGVGNIGYHSKTNLCGYDSFLHATICSGGGGLSHSPPPPPALPVPPQASTNHTSLNTQLTTSHSASNISGGHHHHHHHHQQQQQIATVQPIISSNSLTASVQPNQIKTSKILRSGSYTQSDTKTTTAHHAIANTTQNSPQYHGYQRLPSSSKHNLSALHLLSPNTEKPSLCELDKWRRDQAKNYDQLLYAKLSEKLQQTNLVSANNSHQRESNQKRKQRLMRQRRAHALVQQEAHNVALASTICLREDTDYATMLPPIVGDPVECENLLGQTSDEETTHSQNENTTTTTTKDNVGSNCKQQDKQQVRHVAEGTLVVLDDNNEPVTNPKAKVSSNLDVDTLLSVENNAEVHNLQSLVDDLDIDEDFEENPDEELEEELTVETESGCNIAADSQNSSNANVANAATLVNTNAHNSGANISASSNSLIHRYVHEHIHHHYHHFEEKEE